jgi:hypothetical protein
MKSKREGALRVMPGKRKTGDSPPVTRQYPERVALIRPITYEMIREIAPEAVHREPGVAETGEALSMNISSGGMLLLMDWDPQVGQVMKIHVPTPVSGAVTRTLAQICWKRPVPMVRSNGTYFVALKYMI